MEIMVPVWERTAGAQLADSKLRSIKDATVALIDDNYDPDFSDEVALQLREQYGAIVNRLLKPNGSHPSPPALIEEAARSRVAIIGIAL